MEFTQNGCDRSTWLTETREHLKKVHIVDTMPDFHYNSSLKSMSMDVVKPTEDQRLNRSSKTGLLLRDNETISGPCSLHTEGIAGAQVPPLYKFTNRGHHAFSYLPKTWEDLPKSTPKVLIPDHVNRPSNILNATDIEGTCPHPKNMKIGNEARNTNPVDPCYILPSYPEPFIPLPKFIKNSLDVGDIEGARPLSRIKKDPERASLRVIDIEGTQPGWKPSHRHKYGREIRNLCLKVEDINGPVEQRVVRPSTAEVYQAIKGSHPKDPLVSRRPGTPHSFSLRNDDIQGTNAGSASWEGTTRRRKEFAKEHTKSLKEQRDAEELALNILTTRVQEQLKRKVLQPRDVSSSFQQLDRQQSGKLNMEEVTRAFKTLRLDVGETDLNLISKAFVHPTGDGYLDYWKLLKHLVPVIPQQRGMQRDASNIGSRCLNQDVQSSGCHKSCYDPTWVADLVASRNNRVSDGDAGNQFQPFNSGRPIKHSKYLKDPPSKYSMEPEEYQRPQKIRNPYHTASHVSAGMGNNVNSGHLDQHQSEDTTLDTTNHTGNNVSLGQLQAADTPSDITYHITREVPVLSVLPEPSAQPAWVNKDSNYLEITRSKPEKVRGREDSIFSEVRRAPELAYAEINSNSLPIFYKLKGMNEYACKPLPLGGPFWPGVVEAHPEDLAPPKPKSPARAGPLPIGGPFWSGVDRPQSAPRISLRRDYPVPPLFSEVHSEINLRKSGQKERVVRTWVDVIGDGPTVTSFVGEGEQVLSRPGMQGYSFNHPHSAALPHSYEHPSTRKSGTQLGSRGERSTTLAHSCSSSESDAMERGRPQTVDSIARGSPAEKFFWSIRDRSDKKLVSALKRPSTTLSTANSVRSAVTFSPFPSRPCTPGDISSSYGAQDFKARARPNSRSSITARRVEAQTREDMESVRLLI